IGRIAAGEAVSRIVRDLAARSITGPTGRPWSRSSVTSLVRVCYLGKRRVGGQLVDADWPAIVPEDVFWQARAVLDNPERRDQAVRRGGSPRPGSCKWLLSYISQCAVCSSPLSVSSRAAGPQYRCSGRHSHAYVSVALMDRWASAATVAGGANQAIYPELTRLKD